MRGSLGILIMVLMFIVRFAVPIGITLLLGYLLHRLDDHWQAAAGITPASQTAEKVS